SIVAMKATGMLGSVTAGSKLRTTTGFSVAATTCTYARTTPQRRARIGFVALIISPHRNSLLRHGIGCPPNAHVLAIAAMVLIMKVNEAVGEPGPAVRLMQQTV